MEYTITLKDRSALHWVKNAMTAKWRQRNNTSTAGDVSKPFKVGDEGFITHDERTKQEIISYAERIRAQYKVRELETRVSY